MTPTSRYIFRRSPEWGRVFMVHVRSTGVYLGRVRATGEHPRPWRALHRLREDEVVGDFARRVDAAAALEQARRAASSSGAR